MASGTYNIQPYAVTAPYSGTATSIKFTYTPEDVEMPFIYTLYSSDGEYLKVAEDVVEETTTGLPTQDIVNKMAAVVGVTLV